MSYRLHRAIGWGMPYARFNELCQLPADEDGKTESLYSLFAKQTDESLTVPEDLFRELFYRTTPVGAPTILERRLLAKDFTEFGRRQTDVGKAVDLFKFVMNPDEVHHVIFFPNMSFALSWHRWYDDLDYAFEQWRDGNERGGQGEPRDFARYVPYGFYPFTNDLMLADGTPIAWDHYSTVEKHPEWVPAVPSEIRWYLTHLGVFDEAGVNELRPLLAQWWC